MLRFTKKIQPLLLVIFLITSAGCASVTPNAYKEVPSASFLQPDSKDKHVPYQYAANVDWQNYSKMLIRPVIIYPGEDHQFDDISDEDKASLAKFMQTTFAEKFAPRFTIVTTPGPETLELQLHLTGAEKNTPVLSTLSRFDIAGGLYNTTQAVRGGEGSFTGSVLYVAEVYDSKTGQLLKAIVTKQYPNPWNLGASMGGLAAAKTGVEKGAEALLEEFK